MTIYFNTQFVEMFTFEVYILFFGRDVLFNLFQNAREGYNTKEFQSSVKSWQ